MKKGIIASTVLMASMTSYAGATIYIAPPDIDQYKQKTDQSFYDLYQNQNSVIAKGKNKQLDNYVNNIKTGNKLFTGNTLINVAQGSLQGTNFKANTTGTIKIFGKVYKIQVDSLGNIKLVPNFQGKSFIQGNSVVSRTGGDAIQLSSPKCSSYKNVKYGKSTYKICGTYSRRADEATFDVITGKKMENIVEQTTVSKYYFTTRGKSTYVHYSPDNNRWKADKTILVKTSVVNVPLLFKENKQPNIRVSGRELVRAMYNSISNSTSYRGKIIDYYKTGNYSWGGNSN